MQDHPGNAHAGIANWPCPVYVWDLRGYGKANLDTGRGRYLFAGFTDAMLQHGAKRVIAIDTGYGQIAAALRNDLNEARRELNTLAPADRAAAQAWLDKADARDAALAASRKFASDAMTALATAK